MFKTILGKKTTLAERETLANYLSISQFMSMLVPLRAEQVSKANLRSKQGGINFTPFNLSLPDAKKKKKKLKFPIWMGVSSKMSLCLSVCLSVCLLSVCHEFVPNYLLNHWSDWATLARENVYLRILILKFRVQDPRVKALG